MQSTNISGISSEKVFFPWAILIVYILIVSSFTGIVFAQSNNSSNSAIANNTDEMLTSSINPHTQVNSTLKNATMQAEKKVGTNSMSYAISIGIEKGFPVYKIFVIDNNKDIQKVVVDPRDGKVLRTESLCRVDNTASTGGDFGGGSSGGGGAGGTWIVMILKCK